MMSVFLAVGEKGNKERESKWNGTLRKFCYELIFMLQ